MRKVSISKARKYIESFGVRLNEEVNKPPLSHGSDDISFRVSKEQRDSLRAGLMKWKIWNMLSVSEGEEIWEVGNSRQVIIVTDGRYGTFRVSLKNNYRG